MIEQKTNNTGSKIKHIITTISTFLSPVIFIFSGIADCISAFDAFSYIIRPVMLISAILMLAFFYHVYHIKAEHDKRITEEADKTGEFENKINMLQEKVDILEAGICQGIKYSENYAKVFFDIPSKRYRLSFRKKYTIISDSIRWYPAQFYCNRNLGDAEKAQEFYRQHQVTWEDLNIVASISYKKPNENFFSERVQVKVLHAAEGNNYKQFHIEYTTLDGYKMDICRGCEISLEYSYEVPCTLWGSYLNRYISYFKESTTICLASKEKKVLNNANVHLFKANHVDGKPVIQQRIPIKQNYEHSTSEHQIIINLGTECSGKFIVSWDANAIFKEKDLNSAIQTDQSQLTNY